MIGEIRSGVIKSILNHSTVQIKPGMVPGSWKSNSLKLGQKLYTVLINVSKRKTSTTILKCYKKYLYI